ISLIVVACIGIYVMFGTNLLGNQEPDPSTWNTKNISNISFKVPEKYSNGTLLEGNSITVNGVAQKSVDSYLSGDGKFSVEVYKNKTAWNDSLSKELSNGKTETEVIKIKSSEVQVFHDSSSSKAFFEVNNSYLIVGWNSKTLDKEMKAILESFN
ncbi:MAG: hypothetical protein ACRC1M_06010, partial [Methanobacteriaceae archaeon]